MDATKNANKSLAGLVLDLPQPALKYVEMDFELEMSNVTMVIWGVVLLIVSARSQVFLAMEAIQLQLIHVLI